MTLILDLPPELESRLKAEAARQGLDAAAYALKMLDSALPAQTTPKNGAELVAYWDREGLFGTRPDIQDSVEHARTIRRKAETRMRE